MERDWFRLVDYGVALETDIPTLRQQMGRLYSAFAVGHALADFDLFQVTGTPSPEQGQPRFTIARSGEATFETESYTDLVAHLEWSINTAALRRLGHYYQLHAAAVSLDGTALLFPAEPGGGKTTLALWLCLNGFQYLTDEVTLVSPDTLTVTPFPKSFGLKEGTVQLLSKLKPELGLSDYEGTFRQERIWYLPPAAISPRCVSGQARAGAVILVNHDPRRATELTDYSKARMVVELINQSFNFLAFKERGVEVLTRLVEQAACFRLSVNDLDRAATLIRQVAGGLK